MNDTEKPAEKGGSSQASCSADIERKLRIYLADLNTRKECLRQRMIVCLEFNMRREAAWVEDQLMILSDEYVEIHNKVLGEYF